jgi:hypothetical protein
MINTDTTYRGYQLHDTGMQINILWRGDFIAAVPTRRWARETIDSWLHAM